MVGGGLGAAGRVLVIGGGGFIGRHVLRAFGEVGAPVAALDVAPGPPELSHVDWITGSVADPTLVASAASGCGTVVFLASSSLPGSSQADLAAEVSAHVGVAVKAAEICATVGVGRFLFASSGGTVYGHEPPGGAALDEDAPTRPRNAYGASKLAIEHYLRLLGGLGRMRTLSLRISNPYGEGQRALRAQGVVAAAMQHAMEGTVMPIWGDGGVERDFLHIADVAGAFVAAAGHEGERSVINVGSGQAVSINGMIGRIEAATGRELRVARQPDRPVDVRRNVLDIRLAARELGWRPSICLDDGLARTAAWWAGRG